MELGKAGRETVVIHAVERELVVPGDAVEVWEAVADTGRLGEWLGGEVELDPVPGGDFGIEFDDGSRRTGFVEELDPEERRLAFWWRRPEDDVATRVEITVEEADDGALVRVVESSPMATLDAVGIPLPGSGLRFPPRALACA